MATDQYHEPPDELPEEVRTFARICVSLIEEAEAIDWYEQRLALEKDPEARAIMENAQGEEFKHFAMNLEFLARRNEKWRTVLKDVLTHPGTITQMIYDSKRVKIAADRLKDFFVALQARLPETK